MDIRLEYNEYEGTFHCARVYDHLTPKGWICLNERLDLDAANEFMRYIKRHTLKLTTRQMKQELTDWLYLYQ